MNTPGGDAIAGDVIWSEVIEARKEKPVIVSMSDVCASGGYYISAAANQIMLQPTSITGSIGVFGGKADLTGFYHKLGMNTEVIQRGKHANIMSWHQPFSTEERNILRRGINDMYQRFVTVVSNGRDLPRDSVYSIAGGRTWMGKSAVGVGLADSYGSVLDAVDLARKQAGVGDDYRVIEIPERIVFPQLFNFPFPGLKVLAAGNDVASLTSSLKNLVEPLTGLKLWTRTPYDIEIR
jgi:protease-4